MGVHPLATGSPIEDAPHPSEPSGSPRNWISSVVSWFSKAGWGAYFAVVIPVIIPLAASVVASYYSASQQCNQDAAALETHLTSILLEINGREERIRSLLSAQQRAINGNSDNRSLAEELGSIEIGADRYYEDPLLKEHSLVQLVNQYNRSLRRVEFPPCNTKGSEFWCPDPNLNIDTETIHPDIETGQITGRLGVIAAAINGDLAQIERQQGWHKKLGPVHLCSGWTLFWTNEPWKLIGLRQRLIQ